MTPLPLYLYVDLECIPSQDMSLWLEISDKHCVPDLDLTTIQPAANLKDPEKIAADLGRRRDKALADHDAAVAKAAAAAEEEFRRLALDATTGHVACVSAALGDGQLFSVRNVVLNRFGDTQMIPLSDVLHGERRMLERFFHGVEAAVIYWAEQAAQSEWESRNPRVAPNPDYWHIDGLSGGFHAVRDKRMWLAEAAAGYRRVPTVVAHHAQFDVRFIWQRCVILGVPVPAWWPVDARPWDTTAIDDTMLAWAGAKGTIGLDRLCRALGIPGKPDDIDGSKVWDAVREGRIDDVCLYCDGDVERLRAVHRRIRGIDMVEPAAWFTNDAALADTEALFEAAEAAADRDQQAEIDAMPAWSEVQEPHYARGFTADGGRFDGGER